MNRRSLTLTLTAFVVVLAGIATARALRRSAHGPFPPYTITFNVETRSLDGTLLDSETRVEWRRSDGTMHETRDTSAGKSYDTYGDPARGVFVRKGDQLFQIGGPYAPMNKTLEEWRQMPGYVRDDQIAGVPVIVADTQPTAGSGPSTWTRMYIAPSLGGLFVQSETHLPDETIVKKPITLNRGEPSRPLPPIPDLPVDRSMVERGGPAR